MEHSYILMDLLLFAFFWFAGWGMQIVTLHFLRKGELGNSQTTSKKIIWVKGYIRLLLGLKPVAGNIVLRPAIAQLLALLFIGLGITLNCVVTLDKGELLLLLFSFMLILGGIAAALNKKQ